MEYFPSFLIVFALAAVTTLALIPLSMWLSYRFGILSVPGGRRQEKSPLPKLGGLAIFGGFTLAVVLAQLLPVPRDDPNEVIRLTGLVVGGTLIFLVGVIDDKFELSYVPLFLAQIGVSLVAIAFQIFIEFFNNPLTGQQTDPWSPVITVALTLFWLMLMMNTVNFLDGLDGLAAGVAGIAGIILFINSALILNQISVSLLPLALVGSTFAFLLFNFHPARIIMGGGALYLGFILAALSIIGGAKMATILMIMGLPLMDLAWQAFNRILQGRSPFKGDRGHLHFRLVDSKRFSQRQVVLGYYLFCSLFGVLTLLLPSQQFKFIAFGAMLVLIVVGFILVARFRHGPSSTSS